MARRYPELVVEEVGLAIYILSYGTVSKILSWEHSLTFLLAFLRAFFMVPTVQGANAIGIDNVDGLPDDIAAVYSFQKLAEIVKNGDDSQIEMALAELPQMFQQSPSDALDIVVPEVCEEITNWTEDLQVKAGKQLVLLKDVALTSSVARVVSFAALLVVRGTDCVTSSRAGQIYELFGELAGITMPAVVWDSPDVASILQIIDKYAESPFTEERRVAIAFLKGLCQCSYSSSGNNQRQAFDRLWKLAEDTSLDVLARCLDAIASSINSLSPLDIERKTWPLIRRGWDQDASHVADPKSLLSRAASVNCAVAVCKAHEDWIEAEASLSTKHQTELDEFLSSVIDFSNYWSLQDQRDLSAELYAVERTVSKQFGELGFFAFKNSQNSSLLNEYLGTFINLASTNGPAVRADCAKTMPVMSVIARGDKNSLALLVGCCEEFSIDSDETVRIAFAKGFCSTIQELASKPTAVGLKFVVRTMLKDSLPEVREQVTSNLSTIVAAIVNAEGRGWSANELELIVKLATRSIELPTNWRVADEFIYQSTALIKAFPDLGIDMVIMAALRSLYRKAKLGNVRIAAVKGVINISRLIRDAEKRDYYLQTMFKDLRGGSYQHRIMIVEGAEHALDVYSQVLFERLFASSALELAGDEVSNVRLRLAKALPRFTPWCQGNTHFEPAVQKLRADTDPDILKAMAGYVNIASEHIKDSRKLAAKTRERRIAEIKFYRQRKGETSPSSPAPGEAESRGAPKTNAIMSNMTSPLKLAAMQPGRIGKKLAAYSVSPKRAAAAQSEAAAVVQVEDSEPAGESISFEGIQYEQEEIEIDSADGAEETKSHLRTLESAITWSADSAGGAFSNKTGSTSRSRVSKRRTTSVTRKKKGKISKPAAAERDESDASEPRQSQRKSGHLSGLSPDRRSGLPKLFARKLSSVKESFTPPARSPSGHNGGSAGGTNITAQALPVQKLARALQARRSTPIPIAPEANAEPAAADEDEADARPTTTPKPTPASKKKAKPASPPPTPPPNPPSPPPLNLPTLSHTPSRAWRKSKSMISEASTLPSTPEPDATTTQDPPLPRARSSLIRASAPIGREGGIHISSEGGTTNSSAVSASTLSRSKSGSSHDRKTPTPHDEGKEEDGEFDALHIAATASGGRGEKKWRSVLKVGTKKRRGKASPAARAAQSRTSSASRKAYYERPEEGEDEETKGWAGGVKAKVAARRNGSGSWRLGERPKAGREEEEVGKMDKTLEAESCVPQYSGSPPWMRRRLEKQAAGAGDRGEDRDEYMAGSSVARNKPPQTPVSQSLRTSKSAPAPVPALEIETALGAAAEREAEAEDARIAPGTVMSLVTKWNSMEA